MKTGKFIRKQVLAYMNNPILLFPFAVFGLLSAGVSIFTKFFWTTSLGIPIGNILSLANAGDIFPNLGFLIRFSCLLIFSGLFLSFVGSFFHAFSIGLSEKISRNKKPKIEDGLNAMDAGFRVFSFKILIWIFTILGAIIMAIPAGFLFGFTGLLLTGIATMFFALLLQFVGFFGKQAVVLEGLSAWLAFQRSYQVIKRNLEKVLLLLGAYLFIFVAFIVVKQLFFTIANYLVSGLGLVVFSQATNFIFTFLILAPLTVLIKTSYFLQKVSKSQPAH